MDILDLAPAATEDVAVEGGTLTVRGLSNRQVFGLFKAFPELLNLLLGGSIDIGKAISVTPDMSLAVMAAGLGIADDKRMAALDALPIESQFAILEAIVRRTCPGGVGPFVSRIADLLTPKAIPEQKAQEDQGGELTTLPAPPAVSPAPSS